jgi:ketosteroid isomerase-like protein
LVKELSEQEGALRAAVDKGDRAALEAMLSERFDLWVGANPDVPTPRAAFINAALAHQDEYRLRVTRRMAVHDFGATAVASFSWSACGAEKPSPLPEIFVVDVWSRAEDGSWKLAVRYADPSGADEPRVPGAADASQPTLPKGY